MARWFNKIAVFTAFAGSLAVTVARPARAQESLPPDWLLAKVNEGGQHCERRAEHRDGKKLYLACGAAGAWEVSLEEAAPRFVRSYAFPGDVVGFVTEPDGRLWVKLQVLEARPFAAAGTQGAVAFPDAAPPATRSGATPAPVVTASPPPTAPAPTSVAPALNVGRVVRSGPGEVVISLGSLNGVVRTDHVELALEHADDLAGEEAALSREAIAVGVVTNVSEKSARVRLGLNESVPVGAVATPTHAPLTSSLSAPPRASGLWGLELFARPFAALDELGGGVLLSGAIGYRFNHLHLQAIVDPLGIADVQDKSSVTAITAGVVAAYDSQYFEMGLGFGAQSVNESGFLAPGSGLTAIQVIRLGAQDGLNLSARTSVALFHSEFQFGGMVASGQIPVTRGYWLLLDGGGGNVGYGYGELGLRVLLTGNGQAGSKFLTVTAGGAGIFQSGNCDPFAFCNQGISYSGPMAGVGGEWRF